MRKLVCLAVVGATLTLFACSNGTQNPVSPIPSTNLRQAQERGHSSVAYSVIHNFGGSSGDGANPQASLLNVSGTLYGTTEKGGIDNGGTVFAITPLGSERVLHSFGGSGDGANPVASLINVKGTFYGTTGGGGAYGEGTVFMLPRFGPETVLHSFGAYAGDGGYPQASLLNLKGTFYGTTLLGGASGNGTVFTISPYGSETVIYTFGTTSSRDAARPNAALVIYKGALYGTTVNGGDTEAGTVFTIPAFGSETVLHDFGFSGDGLFAQSPLVNLKGTFYGTTYDGGPNGGGIVYSMTPSGTETVLHGFGGSGDGSNPYAAPLIAVKGTLYGTTYSGGANGTGTVFSITPSGTETVLHSFGGSSGDGTNPYGGLVNVNGTLYGTTEHGGTNGSGTVFSLKP